MGLETTIRGMHDYFPSTRYSLFVAVAQAGAVPSEALDQVAALYWRPVYKYIRFKWRQDDEAAKDLTQSFFANALERQFFQQFDPLKATFRTYLRMAVDRFAANEYAAANRQKRGGGMAMVALDDTGVEYASPALTDAETPEAIFLREWQRQLFSLAVEDLRDYCTQSGRRLQFQVFAEYDLTESERPAYAELARRHEISVAALNNHIAWSRRMLRTFLTGRLCDVTSGDRELRHEMRLLLRSQADSGHRGARGSGRGE